jgi:hypothetical protein
VPDFADRLCDLIDSRLPVTVESGGSQDDWNIVGPAVLVSAARHLRAITHLQATFPSGVIVWQLVRSLFEYVTTYAWVAADTDARTPQWLKSDYQYRLKLANDLERLSEGVRGGGGASADRGGLAGRSRDARPALAYEYGR